MTRPSSRIACVVLAAGQSRRMGAQNKLTCEVDGKAMVRHAVEAAVASRADGVVVVTGHQAEIVRAVLAGLEVAFVHNPDFASGLASSLKVGIRAVPEDAAGAAVILGDMPRITASHIDRLLEAFCARAGETPIVVPTHQGRRGNPVIWPRGLFVEMLQLDGDAGAKRLMSSYADRVREIEMGTTAIFADVDTPEALAAVRDGGIPET